MVESVVVDAATDVYFTTCCMLRIFMLCVCVNGTKVPV